MKDTDDPNLTPSAILLSEYFLELNEGAGFLTSLNEEDSKKVRNLGKRCSFKKGEAVFNQGGPHTGVWIIEEGRVRTYYVGPSGREITLAYWSPGHFVGGPEVFARGRHVWSADALEPCEMLFLSGPSLLKLVKEVPDVALAVIDGLVAKGKSYSALIQMLGTRTVSERLSQLLVILADAIGRPEGDTIVIDRTVTYEQIAAIVGATRQWVTQSLDKHKAAGVLDVTRTQIIIHRLESLEE